MNFAHTYQFSLHSATNFLQCRELLAESRIFKK
jgi:hypothetical protein